jgi:hypothetical protein
MSRGFLTPALHPLLLLLLILIPVTPRSGKLTGRIVM